MKSYFSNVVGVGELYLEYVFFEFEGEPILFVCSDRVGELYLCVCTEIRYEQDWIVTLVDKIQMKEMIKQNKDIRSAFIESKKIILINMTIDGSESSKAVKYEEVDPTELPDEGVYIQCDIPKVMDYLREQKLNFCIQIEESLREEGLDRNIEYAPSFIVTDQISCIRDHENPDSIESAVEERSEKNQYDRYTVEDKCKPYQVTNEQSDSWIKISSAA